MSHNKFLLSNFLSVYKNNFFLLLVDNKKKFETTERERERERVVKMVGGEV
jgi:hypothetical protein